MRVDRQRGRFGKFHRYDQHSRLDHGAHQEPVIASCKFGSGRDRRLANRLDVQRSAVRLIQAVDATWPDGGLGCSPPGTTFATGPIAGYLIVLNHGDRGYDYHSNRDGPAFLCPTEDKDGGYQLIPPPGFDT